MNRERPTVILVMAILNFVFGGLFIICGMCGIFGALFTGALFKGMAGASKGTTGTGPDPFAEMGKMFDMIPGYYPVQIGSMLMWIVLNIVLIVAGVGLLQMKSWARWTSVGYGVASIFLQLVIMLYAIFVVQPAMEKWAQDFTAKMGGGQPMPNMSANSAMSSMGSCFSFILYTAYPVALMIVMLLPAVGAAFSAPPLPPEEPPGGGYGGLPPSSGPGSPHVAPRRF